MNTLVVGGAPSWLIAAVDLSCHHRTVMVAGGADSLVRCCSRRHADCNTTLSLLIQPTEPMVARHGSTTSSSSEMSSFDRIGRGGRVPGDPQVWPHGAPRPDRAAGRGRSRARRTVAAVYLCPTAAYPVRHRVRLGERTSLPGWTGPRRVGYPGRVGRSGRR